jgi:hypothetical protein
MKNHDPVFLPSRFARSVLVICSAILAAALSLVCSGQAFAQCTGDCNADRTVTIDEILRSVCFVVGCLDPLPAPCEGFDDGASIAKLITAVNNALSGCPTPVSTPSPTVTPTVGAFNICGRVQEHPFETGYARDVTVVLNPGERRTRTGTGIDPQYCFDSVLPGAYELSVADQCNPFGCWPPVMVQLSDTDLYVFLPIEPLPTPTASPSVTATPSPTTSPRSGFSICGRVQEHPFETGYARDVTVVLNPGERRTRTGTGIDPQYCFDSVLPGAYELSVADQCNPFGCWPPVMVQLSDTDLYVFLPIEPPAEEQ